MRIALVTEYYYPHFGGVTEHVHYLAAELRTRGHDVDIVTSRLGDAPEEPGLIRLGRSMPVYINGCLLYTSPSPRDGLLSRMPSSA